MNVYYIAGFPVSDELYHTGIKDMKWYKRRFQNYDGTLTDEGYERYYGHPRRKKGNVEVSDTGTGNAKAGAEAGRKAAEASKPVGIRRYQNPDGSLTEEGKKRYSAEAHVKPPKYKNDTPENMAKTMNQVLSSWDEVSRNKVKYAEEYNRLADEFNALKKKGLADSREADIILDKAYIAQKRYTESALESVGYLSILQAAQSDAKKRGYDIVTENLSDPVDGKSVSFYYTVNKK